MKNKTPANVTRAIAATKSAWQMNKTATNLIRIVLDWYLLVLKRDGVPSIDVLVFVGEVVDRYLVACEGLVGGQNHMNDHERQIPNTAATVLSRVNQADVTLTTIARIAREARSAKGLTRQ